MTSDDVQQTPMEDSSGVHPVNIALHQQITVPQPVVNTVAGQNGTAGQAVIAINNLKKTYLLGETRVHALRGVSLTVQQGEFVAVMGPSGSGKTTLMNLLGCLDRPSSGDYLLAGKLVSRMSPDELALIRNQLIGFVFQGFNLLSRATAVKNVAMPLMYAGYSKEEQEYRARKALQLVGLGARLHHKPSQLSGGQQQRVAIARALVNSPSLLLADEPTGNLDSRTSVEIMAVLQALNQRGLTVILVTHEPDIAGYAKRQVAFRDGLLVRDDVVYDPRNAITELSVEREATHAVTPVKEAE
ncbi:MAG TPA: ABC transporter ATP-binding protein [Ktedonobacteraceae bacterium]|nr:ABC transporter ATP-binding protein [Ktedonobacteraceae bacterium]